LVLAILFCPQNFGSRCRCHRAIINWQIIWGGCWRKKQKHTKISTL